MSWIPLSNSLVCLFLHSQVLPTVSRLYVPAVQCPSCQYANDFQFQFCQMCGFHRPLVSSTSSLMLDTELTALDARVAHLQSANQSTSYSKQKNSLHSQFQSFLSSLPGHKTPQNATPQDVCRFLAWKDAAGKTQVHRVSCHHLGQHGRFNCDCPLRLAYGTVGAYRGKLLSLINI